MENCNARFSLKFCVPSRNYITFSSSNGIIRESCWINDTEALQSFVRSNETFRKHEKYSLWHLSIALSTYLSTHWLRGLSKNYSLPKGNEFLRKFRRCPRCARVVEGVEGALSLRGREVNRYLKKDSRGVWKAGLTFARLVIKRLTHVLPSTSARVQSHREIGKLGRSSAPPFCFSYLSSICSPSLSTIICENSILSTLSRCLRCTRIF